MRVTRGGLQVLSIFLTIEHAHIGQCGQLALGFGIASAVTKNVLLGLLGIDDDTESLCIARFQHLVVCVVDVIDHSKTPSALRASPPLWGEPSGCLLGVKQFL